MDTISTIKDRRTIRKFLNKDIPEKEIKEIVEAAVYAPSACNIQGWRFIIITDLKVKQKIVDHGAASFILGAPLGIVITYDNRTENTEYKDYIESASAAIQNMILAAWSKKIGCCWVNHLPEKNQLRNILKIPKEFEPVAYVVLGYFEKKPNAMPRKLKIDEVISYNKFNFNVNKIKYLRLKRIARKIYYFLPFKKIIKSKIDSRFEKKFD